MDQKKDVIAYKKARGEILLVTLITIANIVILFSGLEFEFIWSLLVPYLTVLVSIVLLDGPALAAALVCLSVAPLALLIMCFILSKKSCRWLYVALAVIGVDFFVTVYYIVTTGFEPSFFIQLAITGFVLVSVSKGAKAGKRLDNGDLATVLKQKFDEEVKKEAVKPEENKTEHKMNGKYIRYDETFAKNSGITTTKCIVIPAIVFVVTMVACAVFAVLLASLINEDYLSYFMIGYFVVLCVAAFIFAGKLSPYLTAKAVFYKVDEKNTLCIYDLKHPGYMIPYTDLMIMKENTFQYNGVYSDIKGHPKRCIIIKAYPEMDNALISVKAKKI